MVERLKGLGEPAESSPEYTDFINAADELDQAESDVKLAAERGEEPALAEAQEKSSSALSSFQEAATAYGFEDCAAAPSAPVITGGAGAGSEEEAAPEEVAPEEVAPEEVAPEEAAPEEVAPETGGAGAGGGTEPGGGGSTGGGGSGGIGPG